MAGTRKGQTCMKFVICDDNTESLLEVENLLLRYAARCPDISFQIEKFSDASLLLHKIQEKEPADIYILDIVMSKITGIDLGREIRKKSKESIIIYVTTSDSFALDAYNIFAIRYLLKPVEEERFFEALDYALSRTDAKNKPVFLVKTKNGLESIPHGEIEYIENSSRKLEIHLTNREKITSIYIRNSFEEEIKELMDTGNFISVHKSFLINLNYVRRLNQDSIIMMSGIRIPISRKNADQVKKKYLLFISAQYN